jgi:uncharacterized protein YjdB
MKTTAKVLIASLAVLAAACADGSGTGSTVPETVAMVQVAGPTDAVDVGATVQLTATPFTAAGKPLPGKLVAWSSSDESVATVSQAGQVATLAPGTVVITATAGSRGGSTTLVVREQQTSAVDRVEIGGPSPVAMAPGATRQLTATVHAANGAVLGGRAVAWASSNPAVVTVSAAGEAKAVAPGTAMVSATSEGKAAQIPVVVWREDVAVVEVTPNATIVREGESIQLAARPKSATGAVLDRAVTWTSGNEAVASVDGTGRVTTHAAGTVRITATAEGRQGTADLRVVAAGSGF